MPIPKAILAYDASQSPTDKRTTLAKAIDRHLPAPANEDGRERMYPLMPNAQCLMPNA